MNPILGQSVSHAYFGCGEVIETDDKHQLANIRFPSLKGSEGGETAWVRYDQLHIQESIRKGRRK